MEKTCAANELQDVPAGETLMEALSELRAAIRFRRYKVPIDGIDIEHLQRAEALLSVLVNAQR